jgi:hypothetical protein
MLSELIADPFRALHPSRSIKGDTLASPSPPD